MTTCLRMLSLLRLIGYIVREQQVTNGAIEVGAQRFKYVFGILAQLVIGEGVNGVARDASFFGDGAQADAPAFPLALLGGQHAEVASHDFHSLTIKQPFYAVKYTIFILHLSNKN